MEHDRQLRFLIPPLVFLASLLWGSILDPQSHLLQVLASATAGQREWSQVISLIFAGGVAVVAIGFLISAIAIAMLRLLFLVPYLMRWTPGGYEAGVPETSFRSLWKSVTGDSKPVERDMLYAVGVYDHCRVPSTLHSWVGRRWNTFMVSVNCCVAIGLAHFVASRSAWFGIAPTQTWRRTDATLIIVFLVNGFVARRQALRMLGFAATHDVKMDEHHASGKAG
jgi:hypothetical protein